MAPGRRGARGPRRRRRGRAFGGVELGGRSRRCSDVSGPLRGARPDPAFAQSDPGTPSAVRRRRTRPDAVAPARRAVVPPPLAALVALLLALACSSDPDLGENTDPAQVDTVEVPELGACRVLTPADVARASNATRTVDCAAKHTAQTYAVGPLPDQFEDADYDDGARGLGVRRLLEAVHGLPRRRREPRHAEPGELGVVPALGEGVGRGRPVVPVRRGRRRRPDRGVRRPPRDRRRPAARPARRRLDGLRHRADRGQLGDKSPARGRTTGGR